jgi:hypothetical protein
MMYVCVDLHEDVLRNQMNPIVQWFLHLFYDKPHMSIHDDMRDIPMSFVQLHLDVLLGKILKDNVRNIFYDSQQDRQGDFPSFSVAVVYNILIHNEPDEIYIDDRMNQLQLVHCYHSNDGLGYYVEGLFEGSKIGGGGGGGGCFCEVM